MDIANKKPLRCEVCGQAFENAAHLRRHMYRSHVGKSYSCSDCGRTFGAKEDLARHQFTHSTGKNCAHATFAARHSRELII